MASLATFYNRFAGSKTMDSAFAAGRSRAHDDVFRSRAIPNEDIYFFVKQIDNTNVVRQPDSQAPQTCWKLIGTASILSLLLVALLIPSAYGLLAGYEMETLREQREMLEREKLSLELEASRLLSPERLQELANAQQFIDPAPGTVVYLDPKDGSLALNVPAKK
ncbi:MAG TPA: hypothetical protein VFQ79_16480 [Bryobacteraceae bacterium]|nr:hypothetical protein [Bryobacteraceae bacterium]